MRHSLCTLIFVVCILPSTSCAQRSIYETIWNAEEYFTDPQLIALCKAIEAADFEEMDHLVRAGVDVNARGKDTMTPLLWGYPMGEKVLEKLLELGADPNTQYNSFFGTRGQIEPGDSLLFIAIKSTSADNMVNPEKFQNYVDILLKYGADPNLATLGGKVSPLWRATMFESTVAAEKLINAGADVNFKDGNTECPLVSYAATMQAFPIMLLLLEHGANYWVIDKNGLTTAMRLGRYYQLINDETEHGEQYRKVVAWVEARGMSIERAKEQWELWQQSDMSNDIAVKKFIREVIEPEIALWLPPGAEAPPAVQPQPAPPVAPPPAARQGNVFVPVVIALVILVFLAGGIWFWTQKRGKIAS